VRTVWAARHAFAVMVPVPKIFHIMVTRCDASNLRLMRNQREARKGGGSMKKKRRYI
jgi:hypothetical protein